MKQKARVPLSKDEAALESITQDIKGKIEFFQATWFDLLRRGFSTKECDEKTTEFFLNYYDKKNTHDDLIKLSLEILLVKPSPDPNLAHADDTGHHLHRFGEETSMKDAQTWGQVAFEAHRDFIEQHIHAGMRVQWDELSDGLRQAWEAAANAIFEGCGFRPILTIPDPRVAHTIDDREAKPL